MFTSNPISIKKSGRMLGLIELDHDPLNKKYILSIKNEKNDDLFNGQIEDDTFLSFDVHEKTLFLTYKCVDTGKVFDSRKVDLYEKFKISKESEKVDFDRVRDYAHLASLFKEEMDSPIGADLEVEYHTKMLNETTMSDEARYYVLSRIRSVIKREGMLTEEEVEAYSNRIYADFYGMGVLQSLDDDPDVGEIMSNVYVYPEFRSEIYYIKHGVKKPYEKNFSSLDEVMNVYSRTIAFDRKELNSVENAMVEARRPNGDRVNIIIPNASDSYVMNIRKFRNFTPTTKSMIAHGTITSEIDELLKVLVKGKANIGIGGEMGTGKTTLINYLLTHTNPIERKVVVASTSEMDVDRALKGHDIVILNVDEEKGFTYSNLMRRALRTTADRIINPESRGKEFRQIHEANVKIRGNLFTAHALEDYAFLDMCVDMYAGDSGTIDANYLRNKISRALDVIIIMRFVGNKIRIKSISEVVKDQNRNFERMNVLYYWNGDSEDSTKGHYVKTENDLTSKLKHQLNEYGVSMQSINMLTKRKDDVR